MVRAVDGRFPDGAGPVGRVAVRPSAHRPWLIAVVGATATGKSALALALADCLDGEVVSCDSTAVYRGLDIGTDKVPVEERRGIPHHLIDVADPTEQYTAARYAREASRAVRAITASGRIPIVVGGTGLYYRVLTRGLFAGPGRDDALRARLERRAAKRGAEWLHRMVARVDRASADRIHPHDEKRLIRALEVFFLTGRTMTAHFADTRSPLDEYEIITLALRIDATATRRRVAARVDRQFESGLLAEVRGLLDRGVPPDAPSLGGLVYRQVVEHLQGIRDEAETRALIVHENQRYARRQLIWFRKEPNLLWFERPGEHRDMVGAALAAVAAGLSPRAPGGAHVAHTR